MSYKLVDPLQGTKVLIEGPYAKSGKTLLAVSMLLGKLNQNHNFQAYGNMWVDHPRYEQRKTLHPKDFKKDTQYIILIDEIDINYAWQKSYDNEGMIAFWGQGASHGKAAVIGTIQRAYRELDLKLLRQVHIFLEKLFSTRKPRVPYAVAGYCTGIFQAPFYQNIENAIDRYDPYGEATRLFLWGFKAESDRNYLNSITNHNEVKKRKKLICDHCHHVWIPKTAHPLSCPKCKQRFGFGVIDA